MTAPIDLIVTADDFGRSSEINRAVLQAHRDGILTTASLMVTGEAFDEAVQIARDTPTLAVGLHLVLVDGRPALPSERVPNLVDIHGQFRGSPAQAGFRYFFTKAARRELAMEIAAQFDRFAATALPLSHVDGHCHLHTHPAVFNLLLPLARRCDAAGIRIPRDDLARSLDSDPSRALLKIAWAAAFGPLSRWCRAKMAWDGQHIGEPHVRLRRAARGRSRAKGLQPPRKYDDCAFIVPTRTYGFMQTGAMSEAYVLDLLRSMNASPAEIYFHPTTGQRLDPLGPNPQELAVLLSPRVRALVQARGIRLTTYPQLRKVARGR